MPVAVGEGHLSRRRRTSVRVLAALGLVTYCLLFALVAAEASGVLTFSRIGSPDDPPPSAEALAGAAAPGEAVHLVGALGVLLLGGSGLIALCLHPRSQGASRQVFALLVVLVLGTAALAGDGWRLGATTAGICAIAFGVTSLVAPAAASAVEATWATATIAWGAAALYGTWRDRQAPLTGREGKVRRALVVDVSEARATPEGLCPGSRVPGAPARRRSPPRRRGRPA